MKIARSATAVALAATFSFSFPAVAQDEDAAADRLGRSIERAMEEDGPWLLPSEQALIERKCGYTRESGAGESLTMSDGVLVCANGRRIDDPEVRAMVEVAGPRISRRVQAVMNSPGVKNALSLLADGAVQRALDSLRDVPSRRGRR